MHSSISDILSNHFPKPPASDVDILLAEERLGISFDNFMRRFFRHCNGATLFSTEDWRYRILPLEEIVRARISIFGKDDPDLGPDTWFVICDCGDGNYAAIDCANRLPPYPVHDVFHEAFPDPDYCKKIADSFEEFIALALHSCNRFYWLKGS